jgi:prophage DNA circulation protein
MADTDDSAGSVFSQAPCASWKVGNAPPISFPALSIRESGGNRIVQQERPFRDGAKLDDTGGKARAWRISALFSNDVDEPGTSENAGPLYPDMLREIIRSFDEHETGDLTLPTVGKVRVRAETYDREETFTTTDSATIELNFIQDNEDALDRALLSPPSAVATLRKLAEQTQFTHQEAGVWNEDVKSLTETSLEIESLLLAPGRASADLQAAAASNRRAIDRIIGALQEDLTLVTPQRGSQNERRLRTMLDRLAAAEDERTSSRPRTTAFVIDVERTSIYEIAARLNQDAEELLDLNAARIEDPFYLTRGEVIRVYETAAR